jgi:hypothetical protein
VGTYHIPARCARFVQWCNSPRQEETEFPDFNITETLINNGVDVSRIANLVGSEAQSRTSCLLAVPATLFPWLFRIR